MLLIASCCYNPLDVAQKTIESVLKHTDVDFQYVLVYNNPPYEKHKSEFDEYISDLTAEDDRVWVLDIGRNTGCHGGIDLAWDRADIHCDYLAKVDDDTIVAPNWASKIIHGLQLDESIASLSSDVTARSRDPYHRGKVERYADGTEVEFLSWVSWSAVIVPAQLRREWGRIPLPGVYGGEEVWWSSKAQENGMRVGYCLETMAFHADVYSRPRYTLFKLAHAMMGYSKSFEQMYSNPAEIRVAYQMYAEYYRRAQEPAPLTLEQVLDGR